MSIVRWRGWLAACLLSVAASSWYAPCAVAAETVLTILHTNDLHGRILSGEEASDSGAGGLARIAELVRGIRQEMPNVVLLDAGDAVHGTPTEYFTRGASAVDALNAVGYDAMTLGNHEFDWGQDTTETNITRAGHPVLAANVRDALSGSVFGGAHEYTVLERGGIRVAVFGLTSLDTIDLQWPPTISRIRFDDPFQTAARLVPILRTQADVVVALSHLGYASDQVLALIPGIDVIIGGHSHNTLSTHKKIGSTLIAQTGYYARNLGRLDLLMEQTSSGWEVRSVNGQGGWWADSATPPLGASYPRSALLPVEDSIPRDPSVVEAYHEAWEASRALLDEVLATALEPITGASASTTPQPLPLLLGDMMRLSSGADIALVPSSVGSLIPAGPVRYAQVFDLIGGFTRRNLVQVSLTEADLRRLISELYLSEGSIPSYLSGVSGRLVRTSSGVSVQNLQVRGATIPAGAAVTLIAPSYRVMDSSVLSALPWTTEGTGWMFDRIAEGMQQARVLTAPAQGLILTDAAPVTLAFSDTASAWTLENGRLRVRIRADDGRVESLVKLAGNAAGTDQTRSDFRSYLDRVERTAGTAPLLTANPDGSDSPDQRSLRVEYPIHLSGGRTFLVRKTYRLRRHLPVLEADLVFRNESGLDFMPDNPQDGAQSIVYVVPGGTAPVGDEVRVKTKTGLDVVSSGTHWWGSAPEGTAVRPETVEGWAAAVDRTAGVVNVLMWDHGAHKTFSRNGVSTLKLFTGANRFQLEPLFTRIPAGQTAMWRQSVAVVDGPVDITSAGWDNALCGVSLTASRPNGGEPAEAIFQIHGASPSARTFRLRNVRLEETTGRRAMELPSLDAIDVAPGAYVARVQRFTLDVRPGTYLLKADLLAADETEPFSCVFSALLDVGPPLNRSGDVDGNGIVQTNDAVVALRLAGGLFTSDDGHLVRGDMDGDGRITVRDAGQVLRLSVAP